MQPQPGAAGMLMQRRVIDDEDMVHLSIAEFSL